MGCLGSKVAVVTYNLYWWCVSDEYGNCPQFKAEKGFQKLYQNIADHNPIDLIGFQECNDVGKVLIGSNLTHFQFYAPAGDAPLAWNAERFDRVGEGGTIAVAEDKYGVRFVNFIRLVEKKSREVIFFANTHGPLLQCAGEKGEKVAANYLQVIDTHKQPGDKVIFTGDFNCASTDPPLLKLQKKLKNAATDMTFAGADHILTSHDVITCTNEFSQGFPSDHDILRATLALDDSTTTTTTTELEGDALPWFMPPPPPSLPSPSPAAASAASAPDLEPFRIKDSKYCPKKSPCCSDCPQRYFCPDNKGCYAESQNGCPSAVCPAASSEIVT